MLQDPPDPDFFAHPDPSAPRIAYRRIRGKSPGIVFCPGFMSDMAGSKAVAVEAWAAAKGLSCLRFDYRGHGLSEGRFTDGTIGLWTEDALGVFDALTDGPQIVVGSSMGGWIALNLALARPTRVAALVGIAAAPDFTEDLIWAKLPPALRARLEADGILHQPSEYGDTPYPITRKLIEDGRSHLRLRGPIAYEGRVRLLHGMKDPDVPWQWSPKIAERLVAADTRVVLVKDGDHRLSRPQDIALLEATLAELAGSGA
jgi:pimeloyl-ACP methyl ester carboxylesterase